MKVIFNFLKQCLLISKISVNRKENKLAVSRKKTKILTVSRKSHHPTPYLPQSYPACCERTGIQASMALVKSLSEINCQIKLARIAKTDVRFTRFMPKQNKYSFLFQHILSCFLVLLLFRAVIRSVSLQFSFYRIAILLD